jgi:hypothetical protein
MPDYKTPIAFYLLFSICVSFSCSPAPNVVNDGDDTGRVLAGNIANIQKVEDLKVVKLTTPQWPGWYSITVPPDDHSNAGVPIDGIIFKQCSSIKEAKKQFSFATLHFFSSNHPDVTPAIGDENFRAGATYVTRIGRRVFVMSVTSRYWQEHLNGRETVNLEYVALLKNVLRGVSPSRLSPQEGPSF